MLPQNTLSSEIVMGEFIFPDNLPASWRQNYEKGGIALSDTSQGLEAIPWYGDWDPDTGNITLYPNIEGTAQIVYNEPDAVDFSFTFDQNMRWHTAVVTSAGSLRLRWFDPTIPGYTTSTWSGIVSAQLALDDKRENQIIRGISDILLSYIKDNGDLCVRVQRDRYLIEYVLESDVPAGFRITNFGMTSKSRVQWRIAKRTPN